MTRNGYYVKSMPQFLIEPSAIKDHVATITGKDARHISQVLRLSKGDWLMLTDGQGNRWKSTIVAIEPNKVVAVAQDFSPANFGRPEGLRYKSTNITLAQALIKHDRFEWIVQKAVELGASRIVPFTSERTIPKFAASSNKPARWQKIALEAAKQCGTTLRPTVEEPVPFLKLLTRLKPSETNILFYEGETSTNLSDLAPPNGRVRHADAGTVIIIGPEGGFSLDEVRRAKEAGVVTCGLGPLILRVETASIAALTLVQNMRGYFDEPPMGGVV